jgi:hypothetical protein
LFRNLFPVLLDTDETPGGGEPTPEAAPAPTSDAPWASDLQGLGLDADSFGKVDGYLRQSWQPRMTQFEQQVAELAPARELYQDFVNPDTAADTFLAVGAQLFGDEKAEALAKLIAEQEAAAAAEPAAPAQQLDPRVQALIEREEAAEREAAYRSELDRVKSTNPDLDEDLFHPFVIAADGNIDAAVQRYNQWHGQARSKFAPAEAGEAAPPTALGTGDGGGTAVPPTSPRYDSIDAALDATLAEMRPGTPPAVGTV